MKVISLAPPNALLAAYGYQTVVTRLTDTDHRGWVALHASEDFATEAKGMLDVWPVGEILERIDSERLDKGWEPLFPNEGGAAQQMPSGAIIGVAWLAKTEKTHGLTERWNRRDLLWKLDEPDYNDVPAWEPMFSDYSYGRRAWWLCSPIPLQSPIPVQGMIGVWDTKDAAKRDNDEPGSLKAIGSDVYEAQVVADLVQQSITLPDQFEESFWRTINRRGTTPATRPRSV